jgi:catechol 2,3-dioxygenase-like lactoylglutathione lyase family enzyme
MDILNHIALPVAFPTDIEDFYFRILGFSEKYRFDIEAETAEAIFNINKAINVVVVEREKLCIELYQLENDFPPGISHVCLNERDVDGVCKQAEAAAYRVVRINRPSSKLAFITDKSGNRFEIKQVTMIS